MAVLLGWVGACSSSSPVKEPSVEYSPAQNREAYISYMDKKLSRFEQESSRVKEPGKLRSRIQDARIELSEMQSAPASQWASYRSRLDSALVKIEQNYAEVSR